jgi:calcium-dependent protein kinase
MLNNNENKGKMSSNLIRKIFKQVNSGFKLILKEKKVYKYLKPSNILYSYINDEKSDFIIKIGDFGLSSELYKTGIKSIAGPNIFTAPEVEEGKSSNKCDLYSIGVILYMLKTGEIIFEGKNNKEIVSSKTNGKLKKINDDEKLNDLISKLVVKDSNKRIEWKDYFTHPFFKAKDDQNQIVKETKNSEIENYKKQIESLKNNYENQIKKLNSGIIHFNV